METMKLTPAMEQALRSAAGLNFETVSATRSTSLALVRRGLATISRGTTQRPNYRYTGRYGATTTVYDAYLGIRLTEAGVAAAKALIGTQVI